MENSITNEMENLIKTGAPENAQINNFIKADEEYQKLLKEGLTTKRGFNILTTEEIYRLSSSSSYNQSF